ncbi:MAG: hypothetical protein L0H79_18020 [Intrasporangium sp.]|uniref:hypothetical protein n=1 Tax=Intrasporangium sp. TaxID=1925024 RepID=UPI0026482234|nr:hypothetical protein [Intrasporangium sp.]MDN5797625.1 hypothetical protein [Intrasporangium sp.]
MSDFNESGELRQVEQDYVGRPAERAEQLRHQRTGGEQGVGTVRHGAGNTGRNDAAIDDHLSLADFERQLRAEQEAAAAEPGGDDQS